MATNNKSFSFITLLLGLTLLVTIHELGHYFMCKIFGVRTPIFSVGFGPRLLGVYIGSTLFQIAALPLGGYVSMNEHDLALAPYFQKVMIIVAGVAFNLIFALLLLIWLHFSRKGIMSSVISSVLPGSPADEAGLQEGDKIIKINDAYIENNIALFVKELYEHSHKENYLIIERNGQETEIPIAIEALETNAVTPLGITFQIEPLQKKSIFIAIERAFSDTYSMLAQTARAFFLMFKKKQKRPLSGITGLKYTIAQIATEGGMRMYTFLLSSISIQLAFFNILPIPLLDGGKLAQYTLEVIFGRFAPLIISIMNLIILIIAIIFFTSLIFRDVKKIKQDKTK